MWPTATHKEKVNRFRPTTLLAHSIGLPFVPIPRNPTIVTTQSKGHRHELASMASLFANAARSLARSTTKVSVHGRRSRAHVNFSTARNSNLSNMYSSSRCNHRLFPSSMLVAPQQRALHTTSFSLEEEKEEVQVLTVDSPVDPKVEQILEDILSLNLLQTAQLAKGMREKLGIPDQPMPMMGGGMPMMAAPGGAAAAPEEAAEPAEEKTAFDVKLTSFDASSKIKVIKEIRAITGLGLKEAKEFVEGAPKVIKEGIKKEECEEIMEKLKAVGGVTEME